MRTWPQALLLDTCAIIFLAKGDPIAPAAIAAMADARQRGGLFVSPVSAWEIGLLSRPGLHGDPADRLLIATARHFGMPIVTRDRRIRDYAAQGHVRVVPC